MSAYDRSEDLLEPPPIERRRDPRGRIRGLTVWILDGGAALRRPFDAEELGLDSVFLTGEDAARAEAGAVYRLRLNYLEREVVASARCLRIDGGQRVGAVLRLEDDELEGRSLLWEALQPSGIPLGRH